MSNSNLIANFDGNQLVTVPGLTVLATNGYAPPKRHLTVNDLARSDKSKTNAAFYNERYIVVTVGIARATRQLLEQSLDIMWTMLQGTEKELVISQSVDVAGKPTVRKYFSTFSDAPIKVSGGSYVELDLTFTCSDRFGYETAYTVLASRTSSSASITENHNFRGSALWQVPIITLKLTAVTGPTSNITIGSASQQTTITRAWAANDFVEIDSFNKTVKVNGLAVQFTGAIPEFAPGAGSLTYSDGFTTRTFTLYAYYYARYV